MRVRKVKHENGSLRFYHDDLIFSLRSTQTLHNMVFISQQFSFLRACALLLPLGILHCIYYPTNQVRNSLESSLSLVWVLQP
jgi:hypothetical protein